MIKPESKEFGLEVKNLRKVYRGSDGNEPVVALEDLDLQVKRGSFFGLLGPNGAGKSTLINILAGLVIKTSGVVKIGKIDQDINVREFKRSIGVVPQETNFDPFLTPYESLDIQAGLYGVRRSNRNIRFKEQKEIGFCPMVCRLSLLCLGSRSSWSNNE